MSTSSSPDTVQCVPDQQQLLHTLEYAIQGIYGTWSLLIYAFNVFVLSRLKFTLHQTFIRLYVAVAFWSSLYFLTHYLFKRLIGLGYFCDVVYEALREPNWYILPYRIISTYCPLILFVLHFLISLHRVTAILYPLQSKIIWNKYFKGIMALSLLFPFSCMWFVIPCKGYALLYPNGGLTFDYERIRWFLGDLSASFFAAIAGLLFGSLTLINIFIIIYLVKIRKLKTENGTLIFEVLMAIFTLIYSVSQAALYFTSHLFPDIDKRVMIESFRNYLIDLFILPQAWIFFFCNRWVQLELEKLLVRQEVASPEGKSTFFKEVARIQ